VPLLETPNTCAAGRQQSSGPGEAEAVEAEEAEAEEVEEMEVAAASREQRQQGLWKAGLKLGGSSD